MPFVEVPFSGQSLGETRDTIRNNLNILRDPGIAENHYDVNDARAGKHQFVNLPDISNVIPPITAMTTLADEVGLYSAKNVGSTGNLLELFFSPPSTSGTGNQISGFLKRAFTGQLPLYGGLSLKWGTLTIASANAQTSFDYVSDFSLNAYTTATYFVSVIPIDGSLIPTATIPSIRIFSKDKDGFDLIIDSSSITTFLWVTIGL